MSKNILSFTHAMVCQLNDIGRWRTAERYSIVIRSFESFLNGRRLSLEALDAQVLLGYEMYLRARGVCPNTVSFYMRNLRAIYNRAVEQGLAPQRYPFKHVYTGIDRTVKRAVPMEVVRQIREMDLSSQPLMDWARNLFLFSFYTRGMSFVDMAFLKKSNLHNGILTYRRKKTGQLLFIKWEKPMQEIVDQYENPDSPFLLPIIRNGSVDEWKQYINASHLANNKLKKIGEALGLSAPLTMYVARHGWASIARSKNIPVSVISEALGHDSEKTTRIYLASLDNSMVDHANSMILDLL